MQISHVEETRVSQAAGLSAKGAHLVLRGLGKRYSGRSVLEGVNLKIAPGEFVAVVGRSGCGKSTLLRAIAGLEQPDAGQVKIGGGGTKPEVRMMFQDPRLLPWKTVLENVALGLPDGQAQARAALASVGLEARAGDWPAVLSGGQRQRVALARALVHQPQLLLLDEPLGALDALTRIEMQRLIESLWLERGFTAVLVTHDVQEAVTLADRVLLIEDGNLTMDLSVGLPHPRARDDAALISLEKQVLSRVLDVRHI
ncbi:ATP-binding cassette domain-containing protein [Massilia norwichensis]|uniref:ATP-binding cassette domain-containing protein n=1 Tax=Massilia norwichensis TaxID=1442366 RepID=A0ABT2A1N2_9BURK|nr:ATP-binding cassette domain-containing protein [Massilia norwichensis]MCS0588076.1 ATP-binding cassette domain-containing protein [Massilia norwichensis]